MCTALKRYFEAHLFLKTENTRRAFMRDTIPPDVKGQNLILPSYKVSFYFAIFHFQRKTQFEKLYSFSITVRLLELKKISLHFQASKSTPEVVRGEINLLLEYLNFKARWQPVNEFTDLGGITLMLKIIAFTYEWNYSGR